MSTKCITPFYVRDKITNEHIPVPCSKCPPCMRRRTSGWSFRLVKEGERSTSALFVTITYDTEYVPISQNGFMTLRKKDVQNFMKRLRKLSNQQLRYYVCGEYGTKKMRPHYHMILFNADKEMVQRAWALDGKILGSVYIGDVSEASIGYTLKYMTKKGKIPQHSRDDRLKEFSLMSKKLGNNYLTDNMKNWHLSDLTKRMYVPLKDGKKIAMPRYYKDKIYDEIQKKTIAEAMKIILETKEQELRDELGEFYEAIMVERHINAFRKMYNESETTRNTI